MRIVRIERDEAAIQALEDDLVAFDALVSQYVELLRACIAPQAEVNQPAPPQQATQQAQAATAAAIATAQVDGFNPDGMASDSLPLTLSTASVTTGPLPSPARP
jgi:hypothetical protein